MEPMIINRRTGEINWDVFWQRAKFYAEITLFTVASMILLFIVWLNNP